MMYVNIFQYRAVSNHVKSDMNVINNLNSKCVFFFRLNSFRQDMDLRVVLTLVYLSCFLCTIKTQESKTPDVTDLSFRNIDFAMNLYHRIARHHDNNIIFSPLGVSASFATLLLAAGGSTRAQIARGLNLASLDDDEVIPQLFQHLLRNISLIQQNTALFVDDKFQLKQVFSHQVKRFFDGDVIGVEFGKTDVSRDVINDYISKKTGGKVREMVKSVEPLTRMMLINTIFFRGDSFHTQLALFQIL